MRRKAKERLAELVREYMRKTGKNQKEVAREACVTLSVLKNAINEANNASDEKMRQIAEAVGADWDVLLAEATADMPEEQTEVEQLREQVELLEKNARAMAAERSDMEQRWLQAEQEKDEAAKEAQQMMTERDDAVKALALAMQREHEHKARADAMELELLRLKAGLYDQMMAERE